MNDCTIETTDEGGDPPCWAHFVDGDDDAIEASDSRAADHAASEPDSLRATTRS